MANLKIKPKKKPSMPKKSGLSGFDISSIGFEALNTYTDVNTQANKYSSQASQYFSNARLANQDTNEAVRIGLENAQIVNIEKARAKGTAKAELSGSGFVVGTGTSKDILETIDYEYSKTIAAIELESAGKANAFDFEKKENEIQGNYLKKMSNISRSGALVGAVISGATAYAGTKGE